MEVLVFAQSVEMLRNITTFHTLASASVERTAGGSADGQKITYNVIKARLGELLYKITSQKFEDPADGEQAIKCGPALGVLSIGMRHPQSGRSNIGANVPYNMPVSTSRGALNSKHSSFGRKVR